MRRPRPKRGAFVVASWLAMAACGSEDAPKVTLLMVARDQEDPLAGGAQLRVELDSDPASTVDPVAIDPAGFQLDLELTSVDVLRRVRLRVEDDDGALVSRGATPEAPLQLFTGLTLRVLMSRAGDAGTVTVAPMPALETAAPLDREWIVGLDEEGRFAMLDLLVLEPLDGLAPLLPPRPGARVGDLGEARTIVAGGGDGVRLYDGRTNLWGEARDGLDEGDFEAPAVVSLAGGGAVILCGGRAEVVAYGVDGAIDWTAALSAPRTDCAAAIADGFLVVYGGGGQDAPAAEVVDLSEHEARTLVAAPDPRAGAGAGAAGGSVLVAGGSRDGEALGDGLWLDPSCDDGCPAPVALLHARAPAALVGLGASSVLVAGGEAPPELASRDALASSAVTGPPSDARILLAVDTGDVWWCGPDGFGVYAP